MASRRRGSPLSASLQVKALGRCNQRPLLGLPSWLACSRLFWLSGLLSLSFARASAFRRSFLETFRFLRTSSAFVAASAAWAAFAALVAAAFSLRTAGKDFLFFLACQGLRLSSSLLGRGFVHSVLECHLQHLVTDLLAGSKLC